MKEQTNPNEPINPIVHPANDMTAGGVEYKGLSKREYFAAMAMQGLWQSNPDQSYDNYDQIASMSVQQADALINALNQPANGLTALECGIAIKTNK